MADAVELSRLLRELSDADDAVQMARFFKTGIGEYGHGDRFLGVRVPAVRALVRQYGPGTDYKTGLALLEGTWHEERLLGLLLMVYHYRKSKDNASQKAIIDAYEARFDHVNNWDLVDQSAPYLTGPWYLTHDRTPLYRWIDSGRLWPVRIAVMSTFAFIRAFDYRDTLLMAEQLLSYDHDLIHKAVGWMLREVGNRDIAMEMGFLERFYPAMPRTMLRYAIEKFPPALRESYLHGSRPGNGG